MMFIRKIHMSSNLFLFLLISIIFPNLILGVEEIHETHRGGIIATKTSESAIIPVQTCPVSLILLPKGKSRSIPQIQHHFNREAQSDRLERIKRQRAVRNTFQHSWNGYKTYAWLRDELTPTSGGYKSSLGGWAVTLIDSLDTLLIMDLDKEFEAALEAVHYIDFSTPKLATVHIFETTIRHLGGLISAYDLTEDNLHHAQNQTRLPGLWPLSFDAHSLRFSDDYFTVGGMADSTYEYLVKEYLLLGAQSDQYREMYISAIEGIKKHLLFHGMTKGKEDILFAGNIQFDSEGQEVFEYQTEHLKCFLGGMVALGSRAFGRSDDLPIAHKLVNGCIWAYDLMPTGIMPETLYISGCRNSDRCEWKEEKWFRDIFGWPDGAQLPTNLREATRLIIQHHKLQPPILEVANPKYRLRPEAIESIFIMYRITGDKSLQDTAWKIFQSIEQYTKVEYGHAALNDTRDIRTARLDAMESFWLAETLKYFYLIFSDPKLISLDDYVLVGQPVSGIDDDSSIFGDGVSRYRQSI
ncbi:hypothetical protein N7481_012514 [Penicillium waksmanii]|uniref:uncharacterized protein n=1 Tax=Penicillium waksmanii TaxID=69791 RepID=UPI0025467AD9|nr:uncharacterized protein N7481_012514 [Penicillium waksmanii]KAJ5965800.1 hypothetical protein N7481_012514 [Penicillium waksmanii]